MTSAPISEIRALLARLAKKAGAERAEVMFRLDEGEGLTVYMYTSRLDSLGYPFNEVESNAGVPDETDDERRAGHLAYPRRVTVAMQALEDEVTKPVPSETEE